jgi:hypothetical protein
VEDPDRRDKRAVLMRIEQVTAVIRFEKGDSK